MAQIPPVPRDSQVLQGSIKDKIFKTWDDWFQQIARLLGLSPAVVGTVSLTEQSASVSATAIATPELSAGLYRLTYYQRVTRAATSSSSLQTTIGWTDGGVACMVSGAAMTGNTTSTTQSDCLTVQVDKATSVTYTLTYASLGATSMQFAWSARLEQLP